MNTFTDNDRIVDDNTQHQNKAHHSERANGQPDRGEERQRTGNCDGNTRGDPDRELKS